MTIKCFCENCKRQLHPKSYIFQHSACKKKLCFWCALEIYKRQIQSVNPKNSYKAKSTQKIIMPCCKFSSENQLIKLESFVSSGCPFDGVQCCSKQAYKCAAGFRIGKYCLQQFYKNFKQTSEEKRILEKIQLYAKKKCQGCHLQNVLAIKPDFIHQKQYQIQLNLCQDCQIKRATDQSKKQIVFNCCHYCRQPQILQDAPVNHKNSQFAKKKFRLIKVDQNLICYFCIYENYWVVSCQKFKNREMKFEKILKYLKKYQQCFYDRCLTCGNQPQKNQNIFLFNDQSVKSPYKMYTYLCGYCHMMMTNQASKITKTLNRVRMYLDKSKQSYVQISEPVKYKSFKETCLQKIKFYQQVLRDTKLIEYYEKNDQFTKSTKQHRNLSLTQQHLKKSQTAKYITQITYKQDQKDSSQTNPIIFQQRKQSSTKKYSKNVKDRLNSIKKITSTEQNKKKFDQIQKDKKIQRILVLDSTNNKPKMDKNRQTQPTKKSNQVRRLTNPHNQANERTRRNKQQKSFQSQDKRPQSIDSSEGQQMKEKADSQYFVPTYVQSKQKIHLKEQDSSGMTKNYINRDSQRAYIYEDEMDVHKHYQLRKTTSENQNELLLQPLSKGQMKQKTDKNQSIEGESNMMSRNNLNKKDPAKQAIKQMVCQQSIQMAGTEKPLQNFVDSKSKESLKKAHFIQSRANQDIFSLKLKQWHFQASPLVKPTIRKTILDKQLISIVDSISAHLPQIIQEVKSRCQFQPIHLQNQKRKQPAVIQEKTRCEILVCKNCDEKQSELLFLQKYCLKCFSLILIGKLEIKETNKQTSK